MSLHPFCRAVGGDLFRVCLEDEDKQGEEKDVRRYTSQLLEALAYMHERDVVHCDLKVMCDPNGCCVNLCDARSGEVVLRVGCDWQNV